MKKKREIKIPEKMTDFSLNDLLNSLLALHIRKSAVK